MTDDAVTARCRWWPRRAAACPGRQYGLAFVQPGLAGLATVIVVELAIIISMSLYNPVLATYRLTSGWRRPGRHVEAADRCRLDARSVRRLLLGS
ncbi:hypothetical protein [Micromonospora sp. NPDC005220]|uniref:hypothetical protein n=1 Tax=Micromonospora sp. NPDC005220 TaxID=3155589 RepID=UPI0033BA555C